MQHEAFAFDRHSSELWKGGTRLKVPDQSLQILGALLERPGRLVTRDDLRQRLRPPNTFVDFESGLNAAVRRLREALHDSADEPRFIETLPRRGYRFIAEVERPPAADPAEDSSDPAARAPDVPTAAMTRAGAYVVGWLRQTPVETLPLREVALTTLQGAEASPTLSPDGQQVAFAWSVPNQDNPR